MRPGIVHLSRAAFVGVIALATLAPWHFSFDPQQVLAKLMDAVRLDYSARTAVDAIRNITLFAGWGALWTATSGSPRSLRSLTRPTKSGAALSMGIELLQLFIPARTTSVLDVITNSAGAFAGGLMIVAMVRAAAAQRGRPSYVGVPLTTFSVSYLVAVGFDGLWPLGRSQPLPVYGGPIRRFQMTLSVFEIDSVLVLPLLDVLVYFPLGLIAVAALAELRWGHRSAAVAVAVAGGPFAAIVEVAHGALGIPILAGPVLVHSTAIAAGALAGAALVPPWSRRLRGRWRPLSLAALYAVLFVVWAWRPFLPVSDATDIVRRLSVSRLIPLQSLAWRVELFSVADIGTSFFLFLPMGALLAAWPIRRRGPWGYCLPAFYCAAVTEVGQLGVAARYFDITDILVQCAAVAIGWIVLKQAGFREYGEMWPRGAWPTATSTRR